MKAGPGWIMYPTRIIDYVDNAQTREVFGVINASCSRDGRCYSTDSWIAEAISSEGSKVSERTASRHVKALKDAGLISIDYTVSSSKANTSRRVITPRLDLNIQAPNLDVPKSVASKYLKYAEIKRIVCNNNPAARETGKKYLPVEKVSEWMDKFCLDMEIKNEFLTGTSQSDVLRRWRSWAMAVSLNSKKQVPNEKKVDTSKMTDML